MSHLARRSTEPPLTAERQRRFACYDPAMVSIRYRRVLVAALAVAALAASACTAPEPVGKSSGAGSKAAAVRGISDIPMPRGADPDVEDSLVLGNLEAWTGRLVLTTSLSAEDSFDFYRDQMGAFHWEPITSVQSEISVLTFERADRVATIQIEERTLWGSRVSITMSPRQSGRVRSEGDDGQLEVEQLDE